jgi:hypothetical protein
MQLPVVVADLQHVAPGPVIADLDRRGGDIDFSFAQRVEAGQV